MSEPGVKNPLYMTKNPFNYGLWRICVLSTGVLVLKILRGTNSYWHGFIRKATLKVIAGVWVSLSKGIYCGLSRLY